MPKVVDRDERRRVMAEAILDIAAREGLGSVTVGKVAVEAAVSKGAVQHYFSSKSDMLDTAARLLHERVASRVGAGRGDRLESMLGALLPRTDADRRDAAAGHALFNVALSDPALRALYVRGRVLLRTAVQQLLEGRVDDTETTARVLIGLVTDLGDSILLGELEYEVAREVLHVECRAV